MESRTLSHTTPRTWIRLGLALALLAPRLATASPPAPREDLRRAQAALASLPGNTSMEKLAAAFEAGTVPAPEDLVGMWSGRAWEHHDPTLPRPRCLLVRQEDGSQRGPLMPRSTMVAVYTQSGVGPDFYDAPEAMRASWKGMNEGMLRQPRYLDTASGTVVGNLRNEYLREVRLFQGLPVVRSTYGGRVDIYAYFFLRRSEAEAAPGAIP